MSNYLKLETIHYDRLIQANPMRVSNERDAGLYTDDAVLYEPDASAKGHAATSEAVTALLAPGLVLSAVGPVIDHHNRRRLKWRSGPPDRPVAVRPGWVLPIPSRAAFTRFTYFSNPRTSRQVFYVTEPKDNRIAFMEIIR